MYVNLHYNFINIVKNGRFGNAKEILSKNRTAKLIIKFEILQSGTNSIKKQAYSNYLDLTDSLIIFKDDQILINDIDKDDLLQIKFLISGEKEINEHSTKKISKLEKNKETEVVWVIGQKSFINLIYHFKNPEIKETKIIFKRQKETEIHLKYNQKEKIELNDSLNKNITTANEEDILSNMDNSPKNFYQILKNNYAIKNSENVFSKEYISNLNYSEHEYDTFCQCVIISGLKSSKMKILENTEGLPSSCGHKNCALLQSFSPSILYSYQNLNKTNKIEINDLTTNLIFPLGIKICMSFDSMKEYPKQSEPFMNIIHNENGDIFYIMSYIYYKKMTIKQYEERYKINPVNIFNKKQLNNHKNNNQNNLLKFEKEIDIISKFVLNETIFIPECISLISRFPFFEQMSQCLKTLISIRDNSKINLFINHIINQVPVPYKNQEILFYIPSNDTPLKIGNPFNYNIDNFKCENILDYFPNQTIIQIFYLILLEQQILFIDNNYKILSSMSYLFSNFIYPFNWSNTYIPILSLTSVKFLQSIIPFIMGADESLVQYAIDNQFLGQKVIAIDISNNLIDNDINNILHKKKCKNFKNVIKSLEIPKIPEKFEKILNFKLNELRKINNLTIIQNKLKYIFCELMVMILGNYQEFFFVVDEISIFNNESFLDTKTADEKNFYKELIQTQAFSQFIQTQKESFLKKTHKNKNIISNIYGNKYNNTYIDLSFFHIMEKDYISRFNNNDSQILNIKEFIHNNNIFNDKKNNKKIINRSTRIVGDKSGIIHRNIAKNQNFNLYNLKKITDSSRLNNVSTLSSNRNNKSQLDINNNTTLSDNNTNNNLDYSFMETKKYKKILLENKNIENQFSYLLYPYFIEDSSEKLDNTQQNIFIYNKTQQIISSEKEVDKILRDQKIPNYIFPSYKRYEFNGIKEDYKKYFPNSLKHYLDDDLSEENLSFNGDFNNNKNIIEKDFKNNNNDFIAINDWLGKIFSPNKNYSTNNYELNNIKILINKMENRKYFTEILFQNYIPNYSNIKKCSKKIITSNCLNDLFKILKNIFILLTKEEYLTCKLLTLSCFIYGTQNIFIIHKFIEYLESSNNNINKICFLWNENKFWNFWLKNDLETKKNNNSIEDISINDDDSDDELENVEYNFLLDMGRIMIILKRKKDFIKNCVKNIAKDYLPSNEIDDLEKELFPVENNVKNVDTGYMDINHLIILDDDF